MEATPEIEALAATHGTALVRCTPLAPPSAASKAALYLAPQLCAAEQFLCLDADTLVLGPLDELFAMLDAHKGLPY